MARSKLCRVGRKYWREDRKAWYVKIAHPDGRRQERRLDIDEDLDWKAAEDAAEGLRQRIIDGIKKAGRPSINCTVDRLMQEFLTYTEHNNATATYRSYRYFLESFGKHIGKTLLVSDLHLSHVNGWLAKHYPARGNQNSRHNAISCLKRMFNWATREMEYFDRNPLAALKKPARTHRDSCPTREQWEQVMAEYKPHDPFYGYLVVIRATGCRPQEMRVMEARHLDFAAGVIHFEDGEIPGKKYGRDVIIPQAAEDMLKQLALKYPEGPLFRNKNGDPWKKDGVNCRFQRLHRKLKIRISGYSARHSKATEMLENGGSAGAVAAVLGHRDPTVVLKFYGRHIEQRSEHLRKLMNGTELPKPTQPPEPAKCETTGQPEPRQDDANSPRLRVIG